MFGSDPFNPTDTPSLDASKPCTCANPNGQYDLELDSSSVVIVHTACGRPPGEWASDALFMSRVPVTITWTTTIDTEHGEIDLAGHAVVNDRAVFHDGAPYLIGRDYADCGGALWRITDAVDHDGRPLVFLLPEGAGEDAPLAEIATDFGPLVLTSKEGTS
ncbi:phiSA1p31-related protein [Streptomyces gardneri]|uniref:phiSA1p31-related protein n=1 Tax=Streptomyces gardneri TaxID=66892 RepID=UPI0035DECD13